MASVENRIVQMQFDNGAFEKRMGDTLRSLDKLNTTLSTVGARNGLQQVADSAKSFNLGPVTTGIEGVSAKFLAMSTIGITALSMVTSAAISSGTQIAKALSLDSVIQGFQEYQLQIGSIQTILANTSADGTSLEQVNAALDELNTYSDKTIYNFAEMTRNIGTFTSAGVDLDLSVQSIKGIANLAAISGSNSQQASTAMYQLSQAIATGSVKLMDWNSVVNAGMGGEVFQKALFETGKMMGTINDVPMGQTFEQWTDAGNSFRGSLQDGWLTAEVLTTTLQGFTGELTEAQITAMGYTEEQAKEIMRLGELGVDSATKVRTLSQLIDTTKEALSSGWAQSFRTIFGDFEEATELFTGISEALGGIIGRGADARNALLEGWANLGGRTALLDGLLNVWVAIGDIMGPISKAFREIFPPMTAQRLYELTDRFRDFTQQLRLGEDTMDNVRAIFRGFFGVLEVGWTVVKEGAKFFANLFKSITGAGSGGFLEFAAKIGDFFTSLNEGLVEGKGIENFFDMLAEGAQKPIQYIHDLKDRVVEFFKSLEFPDLSFGGVFDTLETRFGGLDDIFSNIGNLWEPFKEVMGNIGDILADTWDVIAEWFGDFGRRLGEIFGPEDFNTVLDATNVGLLGGIALLLKKFLDNGIGLDFGDGLFAGITETFGELTNTLKVMQTDIKSNALLKIAAALGLLTISVILLSTVDSVALTKALLAMSVGFGALIGTFAILNTIVAGPAGGAKLALLAGGLVALAGAILILSFAMEKLADISWPDLAKGLLGVSALLAIIIAASIPLSVISGGLARTGAGMIVLGVGLLIMAEAVEKFAQMDWAELGKGLAAVAGGLALMVLTMQLMPPNMAGTGLGVLLVAASLNVLALAVKEFATISWDDMSKGMAGIGGGLLIVGLALNLFPPHMVAIGLGLLAVSASLILIAKAIDDFAEFSWTELGKGLGIIAASLILLAAGARAMSGAIGGAFAIGIMAGSLLLMAEVLKEMSGLSWGELVKGLAGLAGVLLVLGSAALFIGPLAPALAALGGAMLLLGAGFALFGLGAQGVVKAIEMLVELGGEGIETFIGLLTGLSKALPEIMTNLAEGFLKFLGVILKGLPDLIDEVVEVLGSLLEGIRELIPDVVETLGELISGMLDFISENTPKFVDAGLELLIGLLTGIRDNIGEITTIASDIITEFLSALTAELPDLITGVVEFFRTALTEVAYQVGVLAPTLMIDVGLALVDGLIEGLQQAAQRIWESITGFVGDLVGHFKNALGIRSPSTVFMEIGGFIVDGLLLGLVNTIVKVATFFIQLPGKIVGWVGNVASLLLNKGSDLLNGLISGLSQKVGAVTSWFTSLPGKIAGWVGNVSRTLFSKGVDFLNGVMSGLSSKISTVTNFFTSLPGKVVGWVGNVLSTLRTKGAQLIEGLWKGATDWFTGTLLPWISDIPKRILGWLPSMGNLLWEAGKKVIEGLWNGMKSMWETVKGWLSSLNPANWFNDINPFKGHAIKNLVPTGQMVMQGLGNGMFQGWMDVASWLKTVDPSSELPKDLTGRMTQLASDIAAGLGDLDEMSPTITPVLDLSMVRTQALGLDRALNSGASYSLASDIASQRTSLDEESAFGSAGTVIKFEQTNLSPKALTTSDIYKQTRNQLSMAKDELEIR